MALTSNINVSRKGPARGDYFGYPIAPGEIVYTGGLVGLNANKQAQRLQTAGTVSFIGIADNGIDNRSSSVAGDNITASLGDTWKLPVPSAAASNVGVSKVYATDDNTLTLTAPTSGYEGVVGYIAGIENGATWVKLSGH